MVLIDIVQIVPCVGVHDDTIDAQTAMGVDVVMRVFLRQRGYLKRVPRTFLGAVWCGAVGIQKE